MNQIEKREAILRMLILIERSAREAKEHICLSVVIGAQAVRPQIAIAGEGTLARLDQMGVSPNGNGISRASPEQQQQAAQAKQLGALANAHLQDLIGLAGQLQAAIAPGNQP